MKPKHIAIDVKSMENWKAHNRATVQQTIKVRNSKILEILKTCLKENVLILTVNLFDKSFVQDFSEQMGGINSLLEELQNYAHKNQIKISVIGKWYELPVSVVDNIKKIISETSSYDQYFFNLCINYDGKEEIIDAFRVILRALNYQKILPENINKDLVKEHLYSSYFIPPEKIVIFGDKTHGFLLWDSTEAEIIFVKEEFNDLREFKKLLQ